MSRFLRSKTVRVPIDSPWYKLCSAEGKLEIDVQIDEYDDGAMVSVPAFQVAISKPRAAAAAIAPILAEIVKRVIG